MRQERTVQATIFEVFAQHEIGCELKAISQWLDGQLPLVSLVAGDLRRQGVRETGRRGLPAETVLRCALLKQQRQLSYEELAFHLEDSASFRAFARLPLRWSPKKSVLHQTISAICASTWEAVNRALLVSAQQNKLESGATVRSDSTVSAALMHSPSDSTLLWDAVRVMTRLLRRAEALPGAPAVQWRDRRRVAKKRARAIDYSRSKAKKRTLYRELIAAAQATRAELQAAAEGLAEPVGIAAERWRAACRMSPFTRSAASPWPTWSRALGFIAGCATSAPGSRPESPVLNAPMAEPAAPGAGSTTSRLTSGPPSSPTTWCCSHASNRHSPSFRRLARPSF